MLADRFTPKERQKALEQLLNKEFHAKLKKQNYNKKRYQAAKKIPEKHEEMKFDSLSRYYGNYDSIREKQNAWWKHYYDNLSPVCKKKLLQYYRDYRKICPQYGRAQSIKAANSCRIKWLVLGKIRKHANKWTPQILKDLQQHLESQFKKDMSWNNYGKVWWVTYKVPLSQLDLTNEQDLKLATSIKNMQPERIKDAKKKCGLRRKKD